MAYRPVYDHWLIFSWEMMLKYYDKKMFLVLDDFLDSSAVLARSHDQREDKTFNFPNWFRAALRGQFHKDFRFSTDLLTDAVGQWLRLRALRVRNKRRSLHLSKKQLPKQQTSNRTKNLSIASRASLVVYLLKLPLLVKQNIIFSIEKSASGSRRRPWSSNIDFNVSKTTWKCYFGCR